jgi:hypothetical protein
MSSFTRAAWFGGVALAAVLAFAAFLGDARAQGFNVKDFSCTTTPFGVTFDVSGLGNTNICLTGNVTVDLNCACVGGGDNCPTDTKKQTEPFTSASNLSVKPKNGRASGTFTLTTFSASNGLCTTGNAPLTCPGGQTATLISYNSENPAGADFKVCTTTAAAGQDCTCDGTTLDEKFCGPTSATPHPGKHGSCAALF